MAPACSCLVCKGSIPEWPKSSSKDLAIDFEEVQLGRCTVREFKTGQEFRLPDGSRLYVRLTRNGLDVRRNGKPLPGSSSDPAVTLRHAYGVTLFVGAGNLLLGALSLLNEQLQEAFGWPNIVIGIALLVLGVFVRARVAVALGFAVAIMGLICVMLLLGLPRTLGGIPIAALFLYKMSKGFRAIDDLKEEGIGISSSSTTTNEPTPLQAPARPKASQVGTLPSGTTAPREPTQRCDICGELVVQHMLLAHLRAHKAEQEAQ
jgi:hypothetical protein